MSNLMGKRINPLSRRPRQQRLVLAVRGAAGTGKSYFASTLADAGLGRLCYFDVERKARLLSGSDGSKFDALEIQHPDELPDFIDWALDGEGREQGYGCYALDSWAMYFGRKHRETVLAVRDRNGDPTAQPTAEELAADQVIFQEVLRRLCVDSGACVVITDQIGAKGKEDREENEMGRVLPLTSGGLEYFVDVLVEASLRIEDLRPVRVFRVVKSNSAAFPIGMELLNPSFSDFLARLNESGTNSLPVEAPLPAKEPELLEEAPALAFVGRTGPTLEDLYLKAEENGFTRADLVTAARYYCNGKSDLERLSPDEIANLDRRLTARIEKEAARNAAAFASMGGENQEAGETAGASRARKLRA
ncbi:MAG: hypothetical protein BGO39_12245 [Chloroflexi bacterium 54-19]|nr:MAG: hypothetical protein BGO39_12245 [Chloroflexi bacterium 54-19]